MEFTRNQFSGINIVVVAFLTLCAVMMTTQTSRAQAQPPKQGGILRFVVQTDAFGFDVIKARSALGTSALAGHMVMDKLFDFDENGELIPILGLSAIPSEKGDTWTVKLRQGVTFHDGTPFNADAVVSHWERILDPMNRYKEMVQIMPIIAVAKTGEYEVQFYLKYSWAPFKAVLTNATGLASTIPSPAAVENDTQNSAPVGTGPFIFKEWKGGNRIVLKKNPDYWKKGKPYLDEIVFTIMPDQEAQYAALVSGQADMLVTDRPVLIKRLLDNPDFRSQINNHRGAFVLALNNAKPPLDDVRVRNALALAWDQNKYIKANCKNTSAYIETWLGDYQKFSDTGYLHHDIEKARALIADYGKPVELEYVHSPTTRGRTAGIIIQQMMKEIGVKITPVPMDFSGIIKHMFSGQYDIASWVFAGGYDPGPQTVANLHSRSPWNVYKYSSAKIDDLLVAQRTSSDPDARADILKTIVQTVNADSPFLYLNGIRFYLFAAKNVMNIKPSIVGQDSTTRDMSEIWLAR